MITTADWLDFFPPTDEGVRSDQERVINFALNQLLDDTQNVLLEGPAGLGKTFIAWTLAQYLAAESGWRTRILVPNRFLSRQYVEDFAPLGLVELHSAKHYTCPEYGSCDIGRGNELVRPEAQSQETPSANSGDRIQVIVETAATTKLIAQPLCKQCDDCPYVKAKLRFTKATVAITNSSYGFTCGRYQHDFIQGDLLVLDEMHTIGDRICDLYKVEISLRNIYTRPVAGEEIIWARETYLPMIKQRLLHLEAKIVRESKLWPCGPETIKRQKEYGRLLSEVNSLIHVVRHESEWAVIREYNSLTFVPVWATRFAPSLLEYLAPRRLLMSATVLDFQKQLTWLGLQGTL